MFSVNELAVDICKHMIDRAEELNVKWTRFANGVNLIDTGNKVVGGIQAGLHVTEICMGGTASVSLAPLDLDGLTLPAVSVSTDFPFLSLLCQASGGYKEAMEGWINFKVGEYSAIASGPARAVVHKPRELFESLGYRDDAKVAVVVLQSEQYPDEDVAHHLVQRCNVTPENLYLVLSPLSSMSGLVQVTGRSIENAMVKLRTLKYDVGKVKHAIGVAPLPPLGSSTIVPDDVLSYGSVVHIYIMPSDKEDLKSLAERMPSRTAKCYGRSFAELIREHGGLRGIDIDLFAPAEVYINDLRTGELYTSGKVNSRLVKAMMGLKNNRK